MCEVLSMTANVGIAQADYVVVEKKEEEVLEKENLSTEKELMTDQSTEPKDSSKSEEERTDGAGVPKGSHLDSEKISEHGSPAQQKKYHQPSATIQTNPTKLDSVDDKSHPDYSSGTNEPPVGQSQANIPTTSSSSNELQLPAIQALAVLSNVS